MRGLKRHRSARIVSAGHAFAQNLRRSHYELTTDVPARRRTYSIRPARDDHLTSRSPLSSRLVMRTDRPTQDCPQNKPWPSRR
jgi:hypothetical protein